MTYYMRNKWERGEQKTRVFWLKVIFDTLIEMGILGIDGSVYQKGRNVHLKLRRED